MSGSRCSICGKPADLSFTYMRYKTDDFDKWVQTELCLECYKLEGWDSRKGILTASLHTQRAFEERGKYRNLAAITDWGPPRTDDSEG